MRSPAFALSLLLAINLHAAPCRVVIEAPGHVGEQVLLHRFDDLFTLRTVRLASTVIDAQGRAEMVVEIEGTVKALLTLGDRSAELFLRGDRNYHLRPLIDAQAPRTVHGLAGMELEFVDLDPLDVNALTTDLYDRLDGFIAEDLATDEVAGMQAVDVLRREGEVKRTEPSDSVTRPSTLFITPTWSKARVDTFSTKLKRFYAEVDDPWFQRSVDIGLCGLRQGPQSDVMELYDHCLKGRAPDYDSPDHVRFLRSQFADHLLVHPFRTDEVGLLRFVKEARTDSLRALLMAHDALRDDDRLCELVMIDQLYLNHPGKIFDRGGIVRILEDVAATSAYPEHRRIATNMVWSLTAMRPGSALPELRTHNTLGDPVQLDSVLRGATCLVITASWCTYCDVEMRALGKLQETYGDVMNYVAISLDSNATELRRYAASLPGDRWTWLMANDPTALREVLRIQAVPAFILLNDGMIAQNPGPEPSQGLAGVLHAMRVAADEKDRIKFGSDAPPPPRR
ncbi:MAG: redoxin domain-containing protein [Flavobacteriales bacterium]|nr:redoxin domain-containing protein [Flavobacteriales bacterium]